MHRECGKRAPSSSEEGRFRALLVLPRPYAILRMRSSKAMGAAALTIMKNSFGARTRPHHSRRAHRKVFHTHSVAHTCEVYARVQYVQTRCTVVAFARGRITRTSTPISSLLRIWRRRKPQRRLRRRLAARRRSAQRSARSARANKRIALETHNALSHTTLRKRRVVWYGMPRI